MTVRYITTPIYYLNGEPHLGHAYTTIAADVLARYWRMKGAKVKYMTGTDEHGQKIAQAAEAAGSTPEEFTDKLSQRFREMADFIGSSHDDFIRTTEDRHKASAQALWKKLEDAGYIYKGSYSGWYAIRDEAYYDESEIVDGKAPTGAPVEWMEESSYFFKLSAFEEPLLKFYEENPKAVLPISRRNEVVSFIKGGLRDLSISRTNFKWGVPVPGDNDHVMYVWIEALSNYLTVLGYPKQDAEFDEFWGDVIHLIGKDILRFHAIYWPAFLLAADIVPPKRIFAHGWWTNDGEKMSKSLGNVIDPFSLIEQYGLDNVRYFLMREVPFGQDGDFSHQTFIQRVNSDLANDLGNLSQRVLSFIYKNLGGRVPNPGEFTNEDRELLAKVAHLETTLEEHMNDQAIHKYCESIWDVISEANRYVDQQKPWSLRKSDDLADQQRMQTVLYVLLEVIKAAAVYTHPIIPSSSEKLIRQLGKDNVSFDLIKNPLEVGSLIQEPEGVFPRLQA